MASLRVNDQSVQVAIRIIMSFVDACGVGECKKTGLGGREKRLGRDFPASWLPAGHFWPVHECR
jgi:hypothetical protein